MIFRLLEETDREMLLSMAKAYYREDGNIYGLPRIEQALDALLSGEEFARLWVIEHCAKSVGYLCITFGFSLEAGGREFFIDEIYLKPEFRNQGIGTKAIEFAENESRKLGARRIVLETEKTNLKAKKLYEKIGFELHQRHLMSKFLLLKPEIQNHDRL